jgi:hypothetical protein
LFAILILTDHPMFRFDGNRVTHAESQRKGWLARAQILAESPQHSVSVWRKRERHQRNVRAHPAPERQSQEPACPLPLRQPRLSNFPASCRAPQGVVW